VNKKWQLSKVPPGKVYDAVARERDPKKDPKHLRWIRSLPCALLRLPLPRVTPCRFDVEAHHPTGAGTGLRDGDRRSIPLCGFHHREELHRFAGTFEGWSKEEVHALEDVLSDLYEYLGARRRELGR